MLTLALPAVFVPAVVLTVALLSAGAAAQDAATRPSSQPSLADASTYTNPVAKNLPDPFVIRHGDTYYAYGTNAPGEGYRVLESPDLVNWTDRGFAFRKTESSWGRRNFWAPCVVEKNQKFFLFYSAMGPVGEAAASNGARRLSHRICVARADSPLGPFVDLKAPFLDIGKAVIDAHVALDPDDPTRAYLYYALDISENRGPDGNGESDLYVVALSADLTRIVGEPVLLTRPSQPWEGDTKMQECWNEGPFVFKHRKTWIMMYSARMFLDPNYSVGYATSSSPLGPFTKAAENPILRRTDVVSGPGHNSIAFSPDGRELFCVYHIHRVLTGSHLRDLSIDRMKIIDEPDGTVRLKVLGPTRTPQPLPSGAPPATQRAAG